MPAGLQVFNTDNIVQIDDEYSNLKFMNKGSVSTSSSVITIDVPSATSPLVAVQLTDNGVGNELSRAYVVLRQTVQNGNVWTFTFSIDIGITGQVATLTYYVFDQIATQASNFGLQTFDPSGRLIFDSNDKWLKIASIISSANWSSEGYGNHKFINMGNARSYAVVFGDLGGQWTGVNIPANPPMPQIYDYRVDGIGIRTVAGGFYTDLTLLYRFQATNTTGAAGTGSWPSFSLLLVDVTGL